MIVAFISLVVANSSYAEKAIVPCRYDDSPIEQSIPIIDKEEAISITFDGVEVDGYTRGLITKTATELHYSGTKDFSKDDLDKLYDTYFQLEATCQGSGKNIENMLPGMTFSCDKGESILIEQYEPECSKTNPDPVNKPDKRSIFTVTRIKENKKKGEKEEVKIKTNISDTAFVSDCQQDPGKIEKKPSHFSTFFKGIFTSGK